jgi:succinate dehydrogenase assembly factor 1
VGRDKPGIREYVRNQFQKNADIPKREVMHIEYIVRRAQRQLKTLQESSIEGMGVFTKDDTPDDSKSK